MIRALVVLADGFEELEAIAPIDLLRRAGVDVTVAGLEGRTVTSKRQLVVVADALLSECPRDFDIVILPGGLPGAQKLADSDLVQDLISQQVQSHRRVAAICAAPSTVLGPLGLLKGKTWSGYPGTEADGWGGRYRAAPVSIDGLLITARGAGTSIAFALALVEELCGETTAKRIASDITWD